MRNSHYCQSGNPQSLKLLIKFHTQIRILVLNYESFETKNYPSQPKETKS